VKFFVARGREERAKETRWLEPARKLYHSITTASTRRAPGRGAAKHRGTKLVLKIKETLKLGLVGRMGARGPAGGHVQDAAAFQGKKDAVFSRVVELPAQNQSDRAGHSNEGGPDPNIMEGQNTGIGLTTDERGAQGEAAQVVGHAAG
jgi:hypothetical protein